MSVDELIEALLNADCGNRRLDEEVALLFGWTKEIREDECSPIWKPTIPPLFTQDLGAGRSLISGEYDFIIGSVNGHVGGTPYCQIGPGGHESAVYAATVELAVCLAAVVIKSLDMEPIEENKHVKLAGTYAIGYVTDTGYGMIYGPGTNLQDFLNFFPSENRPCRILRFLPDGEHEELYDWDHDGYSWMEIKK